MINRNSIFDLERRVDLHSAFRDVIENLNSTIVHPYLYKVNTLFKCLDEGIRKWPYRRAANSISAYSHSNGFSFSGRTEGEMIYCFELLVNLIKWVSSCEFEYISNRRTTRGIHSDLIDECQRCYENIEYLVEQFNMIIRKKNIINNFPQYVISKRDVDVDAVLETVPELSEVLLSYLDIRNQNDIEAKRMILKQIADFLEPNKLNKVYSGTSYNTLCDDLFYIFNSYNIRHNNDEQIKLTNQDYMNLFDRTFKAAIHLLQKNSVDEFHLIVKKLKGK